MVTINESLTVDLTLKTQKWQAGLDKAGNSSQKFVTGLDKMNQKLTKILIEMKKVGSKGSKGIDQADKSIKKLNKSAKTGASALGGMRSALVSFAATAGGLSFFGNAISSAREFETSIREVMTILPQGSLSMQQTEKIVNDLALSMGEDAPKAARAMYQAISAGVEPAKAKNFLEDAATLAVAGVTTLETSVDLLTSVTNAYGLEIKNAGALSDSLFETVRLGKTTVQELASTMGRVAPTASAAGVGVIEVESALAALTSAGVKTKEAGTQIVAMLNAVIAPSEDAVKLAKELGIEFNAQALEAKGLKGFLDDVAAATGNDIEMMARLFPSVRGLGGVLNLSGKVADKFAKSIDSITVAGGKAKEAQRIMAEGFAFNMGSIESAAKQGQTGVGKSLVEMIFDVERAGDQSAVFALKIKAFFKDIEVGVGFLVNQVFRRMTVGLTFLGNNAINTGKTMADAFNVATAEIKSAFISLQITANDAMEFLGIVDEDVEFGKQLKKDLAEAEKAAERSLGDVFESASKRGSEALKEVEKGLREIDKKHKLTIKSAGEANNLRAEAEILTKKIAKAAKDLTAQEKNIADKLKSQTDQLKQQKAIKAALAKTVAKEDRARDAEDFRFNAEVMINRALNSGLSNKVADDLFKFVSDSVNTGTDFTAIENQFNDKLNTALNKGADAAFKDNERLNKAAQKEQDRIQREMEKAERTAQREARRSFSRGASTGIRNSERDIAKAASDSIKKAFGGVGALAGSGGRISNVVATRSFATEQQGRDAFRASQLAARSSLGFSNQANFLPGDLLNRRPFGFSKGGMVPGPNIDRDMVPIMASPGEVIINRQSAQAFLPLLNAINRQTITPAATTNNINLGGVNVTSQQGITDDVIDSQIVPRLRQLMRFNRL